MSPQAAAFFDVDGTIVPGNIVLYYARLRTFEMSALERSLWTAGFLPKALYYYLLDKRSRRRFNIAFYRNYAGRELDWLQRLGRWHADSHLKPAVFPGARERIRWHQERGHPVVFVSGSLHSIVDPLAEWLETTEVCAADLESQMGVLSGKLSRGPLADQAKAEAVCEVARRRSISLEDSFAYADSLDDAPMLKAVGNPCAVNPDSKLRQLARLSSWEIVDWKE